MTLVSVASYLHDGLSRIILSLFRVASRQFPHGELPFVTLPTHSWHHKSSFSLWFEKKYQAKSYSSILNLLWLFSKPLHFSRVFPWFFHAPCSQVAGAQQDPGRLGRFDRRLEQLQGVAQSCQLVASGVEGDGAILQRSVDLFFVLSYYTYYIYIHIYIYIYMYIYICIYIYVYIYMYIYVYIYI